MVVSRVLRRLSLVRWLVVLCALAVTAALLPPVRMPRAAAAAAAEVPAVSPGAGPVDRPAPASATSDAAVPPDERPPVVPLGIRAGGKPRVLSPEQWAQVPKPGAPRTSEEEVFTSLLLYPGYVLGDTSLVAYFDMQGDAMPWSSWKVTLYEAASGTEQASASLTKTDLEQARCGAKREYCRSFGAADGWALDPAKEYFVTITAVFSDGTEVVSDASGKAKPRNTLVPTPISPQQAAGCGCGNALGITAGQAVRAIGVNTATGAFSRVEQDLGMASFGIPFASTRTYSSANPPAGPFGAGWAWSYGMRVTAGAEGAVVRAEDGAEALYRLVDGAYVRPAGTRSTLRKAGTGWQLVTPEQITYSFDAQGRLVSVLNPRDVGVRLAYTATGLTVTDPSGRVATVTVEEGLIRKIILPDYRKVTFGYENSRLTSFVDARGFTWKYRYSPAGLLTEVVTPQNVVDFHNEYNAAGRVVSQKDAVGNETTFAWDAAKQESVTTDPDGVHVYDGYRGNVLIYSQRGNGDVSHHRYDRTLNRELVVNGNHNQHVAAYDAAGNRISQTAPQPLGFSEKTKYDERNNPIEFVDGQGNVWKQRYNEFNELVESEDAENHKITYAYDSQGLLASQTDQRGKVTRYEYLPGGDPNAGLPKAVITPEGRRSEFGYDKTGRRITVVDPRGTVAGADRGDFTTRFGYDAQDRVTAVQQPGKHHASLTFYDEVGRTKVTKTPTGVETRYSYFPNGLLEAVKDPRKHTSFTYTKAGRKATSVVHLDDAPDMVTTYGYNAKGLLQKTTSPRGNVPGANPADFTTTYTYDANDNMVRMSRPYPGGKVVHRDINVDELDRTSSTVDEHNRTATVGRDNSGNLTSATDTMGRTTQLGYDRNGRQTSTTDSGKGTTKYTYDAAGNKTSATTPTGGKTTWEYDDDGLLVSTTEPRGNIDGADKERFTTHYTYDPAGNARQVIDPLDHATTYSYDANNRLTAVTDAKNRTTHYTYREDDQLSTVHTPDAPYFPSLPEVHSTVYGYHDDGLLAWVRDPYLHYTKFDYDKAGRLTTSTDPLGRRTQVSYDAENNPVSGITVGPYEHLDPDERAKRTIVDSYDIVNRRDRRALGTEGPVYTWGYDAKDRTTSYGDPTGVREVAYDDEDQITKVTRKEAGGREETFSYGYDERGNITSRTYPDGTKITAAYDADSRVTELTTAGGTAAPATWKFGYDVAGRRTSTTLPTGLVERRGYDDAGRLVSIAADPVSAYQLTLDEVGNPTRVMTTRGGVSESVAYAYDKVDRVTSACYAATSCDSRAAGRIDYTYDLLGNRKSQKRSGAAGNDATHYYYDSASQLTKEVTTSFLNIKVTDYDYDVRGNQTQAGRDRLTYNLDNSLAKATVGGQETTFRYDAAGLRLSATTGSGENNVTQRWAWDVNDTLPQIAVDTVTNASGQAVAKRSFAYGPDDEPLALLDPTTGAHPYTHDWLGGVANMISPTGVPEAGYDYDPFGNPRTGTTLQEEKERGAAPETEDAGPANPLRYVGAYQDNTTGEGNYYLRARNYDPGTGRFSAVDPMPTGSEATSPYVYGDNNPLAFTDPTGMTPEPEEEKGPSPEDVSKAQQIQSKSWLDVVIEAGGQILMEFLGINDILNCLNGDLGACVSMVVGALPWGKIFKAPKIAGAIFRAGKAVVNFFQELKWARAIMRGAERAAEAAKAAAAKAAREAAAKRAAAKAAAEAAARKAAAKAAARAKAKQAAKAKAKTKKGSGKSSDRDDDVGGGSCPVQPVPQRHSFVSGTKVLLANGTSKRIEQLQPGDTVQATDPTTGKSAPRQVTHTIRTDDDKQFVDLTIRDSNGDKHHITATDHHPFWSATRGRWINAGDLKPGELLRTSAGTHVQLTAVRRHPGLRATYDLTVDTTHTYYVVAGDASVLVHNCGGSVPRHSTKCACATGGKPRIVRNQYGRAGGPAHQRVIDDVERSLQEQGFATRREAPFNTPGGFKPNRAADVAAYDSGGNLVSVHQVGLQTKGGIPVMRETEAMSDIWSVLDEGVEIVFHPYGTVS